jgi:hypothetical protein
LAARSPLPITELAKLRDALHRLSDGLAQADASAT